MHFVSGPPVIGSDFLGREKEIKTLNDKIIGKSNWSVVGLPRIGKTSLVDETLRRYADDYEKQGIYFIRSTITGRGSWEKSLFYEFAALVRRLAGKTGDNSLNSELDGLYSDVQNYREREDQWIDICESMMKRLPDAKVVVVIDEFDYAPQYFYIDLMLWRRLISVPRIRMVTISRSTLSDLFPEDSGGSNFPGIFDNMSPQYLQGFSESDMELLREKAGCSESIWNYISAQAGNMPFFLSGWINAFLSLANDNPSSGDGEIIELLGEAHSYNFHEAAQSLFKAVSAKGDLPNQLLYFRDAMNGSSGIDFKKCKSAQIYGIISAKPKWQIPVLCDFLDSLQQAQNDKAVLKDLLMRIGLQVKNTEDALRDLTAEVGASVQDVRKYIMKVSVRLSAVQKKIICALELDDLETDTRCFISESELNGFEQILGDWIRYYRTKFREGS